MSETMLMQIILCLMVYQIVIFFATLVADYKMFAEFGRKKWLGIIPVVNDFVLFDIFWKRPLFFLYEICYWGAYIVGRFSNDQTIADDMVSLVLSLVMLILLIGLYDRIAKAYGKNFLWTIALAVCYPLFVLILVKTVSKKTVS